MATATQSCSYFAYTKRRVVIIIFFSGKCMDKIIYVNTIYKIPNINIVGT